MEKVHERHDSTLGRRDFVTLGLSLAAAATWRAEPIGAQARAAGPAAVGRRRLGALDVSSLGLGCMSMAGVYNAPPDRQAMVALIRGAYDRGVTLFDTAEVYGPFISEEIVGEALARSRARCRSPPSSASR